MELYYQDIHAIEQQTRQLSLHRCLHCLSDQHLILHAYIYKKRTRAEPEAVGKRVFCSNRGRNTGCGRTTWIVSESAPSRGGAMTPTWLTIRLQRG